jgi:UDP-GlcNAc:undecaprenyl-phosphate/decaprenyl-phosphate GlcNAc-1-phosphate transferase
MSVTTFGSLVSFFGVLALLRLLHPLALKIGLIDAPGGRKLHSGKIPLIGGLVIYAVLWLSVFWLPSFSETVFWLLTSAGVLVLVGTIDDFHHVPAFPRLLAQAAAAIIMIYGSGLYLHSPFAEIGIQNISPEIAIPITVIAIVGLVNAFNMIDGVDGLAGSITLVAILMIILGQSLFGYLQGTSALMVFAATVLGYLAVNLTITSKKKVFLGDAGSLLLGFVVGWTLIITTQSPKPSVPTTFVIWTVALPAYDILAVMIRRILKGKSPFYADRTHLHHICLRAGLGGRQALGVMILISLMFSVLGILLTLAATPLISLSAFIGLGLLYIYTQHRIWKVLVAIRALVDGGLSR